jgi:hypothetical protein
MSAPQSQDVAYPVTKGISVALAGFGVATWGDLAAMLAAIYSAFLIGEWLWKKVLRAFFARHGLVERRKSHRGPK